MWEIKITLDNAQPSLVMVTALHQDGFSYAENLHINKFDTGRFVQEAIVRRNKWTIERSNTLTTANAIAKDILTALNKEDGIEGIELATVADNNMVQCLQKIEPIKDELMIKK